MIWVNGLGTYVVICVYFCKSRYPHMWRGQSNLWAFTTISRAYGIRIQRVVNLYSSVDDLGGMIVLISSLTWMKHGHWGSTPTGSYPSTLQTNGGGNTHTETHMHVCTHSQKSSQACTNLQHLFFIIIMLSAGGKVGLCYTTAVQLWLIKCEVGWHWHLASNTSHC